MLIINYNIQIQRTQNVEMEENFKIAIVKLSQKI